MMIKSYIIPYYAALITSQWLLKLKNFTFKTLARLLNRPHKITLYYCVNDPYSFLIAQLLPTLSISYKVEIHVVVVPTCNNIEKPEYLQYAISDCLSLAKQYQLLNFEQSQLPTNDNISLANHILLHENNAQSLTLLIEVSAALWTNDTEKLVKLAVDLPPIKANDIKETLNKNLQRLHQHGHYQSAILYYGGQWYWGIDRLQLLLTRLRNLNLALNQSLNDNQLLLSPITTTAILNDDSPLKSTAVDVYFSFRSPYSYIAIKRLLSLQKTNHLELNFKPLLPMVMRGLPVNKTKRMYILHDASRVAFQHQLPFGKICDPLGDGILQCINLFYYAKQYNKEQLFLEKIMTGIWSQGLNVNSPKQLKKHIESINLDWPEAQQFILKNVGEQHAESNRESLLSLGLWGVPSFNIPQLNTGLNDMTYWGQDRIDVLINELNNSTRI